MRVPFLPGWMSTRMKVVMLGGMGWAPWRRRVLGLRHARKRLLLLYLVHVYRQRSMDLKLMRSKRIQAVKVLKGLNRAALERILRVYGQGNVKENVPPWVSYRGSEEARWLNAALEALWVHLDRATSNVIVRVVGGILSNIASKIGILTHLKFATFSLGTIPPTITGGAHGGARAGLDDARDRPQVGGRPRRSA